MRGLLLSVWLLLAGLYTTSLIALIQPFSNIDDWPAPPPANETVRAKEPLSLALQQQVPQWLQPVAYLAPSVPKVERRDEWVQIASYTTMVRAEPTTAAPVLFAYAAGRPLRVIAREAGFARVQDLGSGQFGWVKESSLAPFTGGYRQREDVTPAPQLMAAATPQPDPVQAAAPQIAAPQATVAKVAVVSAKRIQPPRSDAVARGKKEMVATAEPGQRGFFGMRRDRPQRVALRGSDAGFAGMIDRAIRGR